MEASLRFRRRFGWMAIFAAGMLPAFIMRCDKAALNVQRGFYEGLGLSVSQLLVEQGFLNPDDQGNQE